MHPGQATSKVKINIRTEALEAMDSMSQARELADGSFRSSRPGLLSDHPHQVSSSRSQRRCRDYWNIIRNDEGVGLP
ncbi:hypothetical protein CMUS01_09778 [Colletotrichum musicola]|uniref:Uncharacterized protein n=1 Tax=Colletotrichum musicola TaxID=2175873 RepID=A0A8H6K686_9PEZI|nr:hypothetical protein CMUS01_09778 [Colletotrichum musicola]